MNEITAPAGTKMIFEPCRDCYTGDESALYGDETAIAIAGTDMPEVSAANR